MLDSSDDETATNVEKVAAILPEIMNKSKACVDQSPGAVKRLFRKQCPSNFENLPTQNTLQRLGFIDFFANTGGIRAPGPKSTKIENQKVDLEGRGLRATLFLI